MTSKLMKMIIMGPPGSGKGTISSRIVRDFGLKYIACGDLLRHEIEAKTVIGLKAKQFIDHGNLVPDEVTTGLIQNELKSKYFSCSWLLDGFPRTVKQADSLTKIVTIDTAINLDVPEEEILTRLTGRMVHIASGRIYHNTYNPPKRAGLDDVTGEKLVVRNDDEPDVVKKRLKSYYEQTAPVLNYYRNRNLLIEFQGTRSDEIYPRVKKYLQQLFESRHN
ncbi:GTP:AMP phosphotransferase-like protein [Leptotrombidium deliense]|uniref:GTP:AMP phosphotransferase, mitochondrial n=1 Tax=Leptotrombidium deliense TaxID=299467 RepID=A0A443SBL1_9ACAR|nr:GTP:AMP phosphotransferase-like protein [Leptotrombidium deliense]